VSTPNTVLNLVNPFQTVQLLKRIETIAGPNDPPCDRHLKPELFVDSASVMCVRGFKAFNED
jgi:hypothetical protein